MSWNWQHRRWPRFEYEVEDYKEQELRFFENAGSLYGGLQYMSSTRQEDLKMDLMSHEATKTSEIEGDLLNRDSIHSSIRKQFGLQTDHRRVKPAEQGIAEMTVQVFRFYYEPLTHETLFAWHEMVTNGRRDLADIGQYRTHEDPMQIVSGPLGRSVVYFEAPPSKRVPSEMTRFLSWFNSSARGEKKALPALVRSAVAHLYFECIHPFEDGNGRLGRAVAEKSLSQSLGRPTLVALSHSINSNKKAYYKALESNNKDLDIGEWIHYFCDLVLQGQQYTQQMISFIVKKGKFYRTFESKLNPRQHKVVGRMFQEGFEGFKGGLSAKNYQTISGAPSATATRDLTRMVEMGAFTKTGELKSTRYFLNLNL